MRYLRYLTLVVLLGISLGATKKSEAQVSFGIGIGGPPVCQWGYYNYAPYACAPYGYYGADWFTNGIFIGAGPWYHRGYGYRGGYYRPGYYGRGYYGGYRGGYAVRGGYGGYRGREVGRGYTGGGYAGRGYSGGGAFRGGNAGGGFHGSGGGGSHGHR